MDGRISMIKEEGCRPGTPSKSSIESPSLLKGPTSVLGERSEEGGASIHRNKAADSTDRLTAKCHLDGRM